MEVRNPFTILLLVTLDSTKCNPDLSNSNVLIQTCATYLWVCFKKHVVRHVCCSANNIKCTYTNRDSTVYSRPKQSSEPIVSKLKLCTACSSKNSMRLSPAQEKMIQSRNTINTECMRLLPL